MVVCRHFLSTTLVVFASFGTSRMPFATRIPREAYASVSGCMNRVEFSFHLPVIVKHTSDHAGILTCDTEAIGVVFSSLNANLTVFFPHLLRRCFFYRTQILAGNRTQGFRV